jgi:hypothetical protein
MDDLEFRRATLADPSSNDKRVLEAAANDPKKQDFLNEIKQLNNKMTDASKITIPDGLAHRLLLRQTLTTHSQNRKRNNVIQLALAASIAFVLGIGVTNWQNASAVSLSEHGIAHVLHEGDYALKASEDITLQQVNLKLARFGGEMTATAGRIYYANFCDFDNIKSLHLVMQGEAGKVSVFIVPHEKAYMTDNAVEGKWNSQTFDLSKASLVVVSDVPSDVTKMKEKLAKTIQFSA